MSAVLFSAVRAFAGVEGVKVTVATTGSLPPAPVTIYADASQTTTAANPVAPDGDGNLSFYVAAGTTEVDLVYSVGLTEHRLTVPV